MAVPFASEAHRAGQLSTTHLMRARVSLAGRSAACSAPCSSTPSIKPQVSALVLLDPPDLMPVLAASGGAAAGGGEVTVQPATIAAGGVRLRAMLERLLKQAKLETVDLPFDALVPRLGSNLRASGYLATHLPCHASTPDVVSACDAQPL